MAKKSKKKIFVKVMSVLMLLVLFYCYTSIAISASQIDGYVLPDKYDRVTKDVKLDYQFNTVVPCDVAFMIDFGYGEANPLIHTDRVKQLIDAEFHNETFFTPQYYNDEYALIISEIYNEQYQNTNQLVYADMVASSIAHQTVDFNVHASVENQGVSSLPLYIPQFVDTWRFWDTQGTTLNVPFGVLLSGRDITLFPTLIDYYTNIEDYVGGTEGFPMSFAPGIGGIAIGGVSGNDYLNSEITYKIDYILPNGTEVYGTEFTIDGYSMFLGGYWTMRVPLIPVEWFENFVGKYDYITIKNVTATLSNNNMGAINPESPTMHFYTFDCCAITTTTPTNTTSFSYDIDATPEILANATRYAMQNTTANDYEWSGLTSWLSTAVGGFMDFELGYGISIGGILTILVAFGFVMLFLKVFAGG